MGKGNLWSINPNDWFATPDVNPYGALNPEQVNTTKKLGSYINNDIGNNYQYTGQLNAPMTADEQGVQGNANRLNAIAGNTYNSLGTYDPNQVTSDFNTQVQDPTMANFKQNVEPLLGEELPSFGTARANVVSRALGDVQNNLLQQRFTAQQTAKQTALNALQQGSAYNTSAAATAAIPREIQQAGLDKAYQNFVTGNTQKQNSINQALNFLGISTGTVTQPPDLLTFLINAGKTAAQVGASMGGA